MWRSFLQRYGIVLALGLICVGFSLLRPDAFATSANAINLLQQITTLAIVAVAATLVMILGEFDLSVGFVASLSAVTAFALFGLGAPVGVAILAGLATGAAAGLINGVLVAGLAVPSFVATLALGTILSGFAYWFSGGQSLFSKVPESFTALARGDVFGVPVLSFWMIGIVVLFTVVMSRTAFGQRVHAIGGNAEAARLAGLPVLRDRVAVFVIAGVLAALAGLLTAARIGSVQHTMGEALLLPAYAAAFLGATASRTGTPNVPGALVGVAIAGVIVNGLTIVGAEPFVQKMVTGAIILAAVLLRRLGQARQ